MGVSPPLLIALAALALCQSGLVAMTGFWAHAIQGWTARGVSLLMLWVSATIVPFQAAIMPVLFARFKCSLLLAAALGLCVIGAVALLGSGGDARLVILGAPLLFCGITAGAAVIDTILSRSADVGAQGHVMGAAIGAGALGRVIGPTLYGILFVNAGVNSPYITTIALAGLGLAWVVFCMTSVRRRKMLDGDSLPASALESYVP